LRDLFNEYAPCLILIDEWVAYARQLHDQGDLPGGSFETHFTFAQALTESAKLARQCLLVVSLPASDTTGSPHTQTDDIEVGGERGRAALREVFGERITLQPDASGRFLWAEYSLGIAPLLQGAGASAVSLSTDSLQNIPIGWFTRFGIWGAPGCPGMSVNQWMNASAS